MWTELGHMNWGRSRYYLSILEIFKSIKQVMGPELRSGLFSHVNGVKQNSKNPTHKCEYQDPCGDFLKSFSERKIKHIL